MRAAHQFLTFTTPTPVQRAVAAPTLLRLSTTTCEWATGRSDLLASGLAAAGFEVHRTEGTYFTMAGYRCPMPTISSSAVTWSSGGVVAIPPSVFYRRPVDGHGLVRFAFCKTRRRSPRPWRGWASSHRLITAGRYRARQYPRSHATAHILVAVGWPYASGSLHLGHLGGAYLPPDIFARYHRLAGNRVLMVSGSDAHGTPITVKADQEGTTPQEVVDRYHPRSSVTCRAWGSRSTSSPPP